MNEFVKIRCKNSKKIKNIAKDSNLFDIFNEFNVQMPYPPLCARVNNKTVSMNFRIYSDAIVEFLDITTPSGLRAYTRSLFFVLSKAIHDLYPQTPVVIDIPVSNGYFCDIRKDVDVDKIRQRMQEIIDAGLPIQSLNAPTEEVVSMFTERGDADKVKLFKSLGNLYTKYQVIDDYPDFYHGTLLSNTSQINLFGLERYFDGLLLRVPSKENPKVLGELTEQPKMFEIFKEQHRWQEILGVTTVGDYNEAVAAGHSASLINISEALQEKRISQIADMIAEREGVKVVLISGPSSSGKTTFSKRLSLQMVVNGKMPVAISLDDYFVNRSETPRDETGDYDYESLYALNLKQLNSDLKRLFAGEEVELPKYDFQTGVNQPSGKKLKLKENDILVLEGIHALNPELTKEIADEVKFKIYASALTTILLDTHNYIPTTDNRLLRRIIRDYKYRGASAESTINRWGSVRAGEDKWIFPYQENADVMFNTAMLFELGVIKSKAEPVLDEVPESSEAYAEAYRLKKFLKHFKTIPADEIPPTSLLREFVGGSSFKY